MPRGHLLTLWTFSCLTYFSAVHLATTPRNELLPTSLTAYTFHLAYHIFTALSLTLQANFLRAPPSTCAASSASPVGRLGDQLIYVSAFEGLFVLVGTIVGLDHAPGASLSAGPRRQWEFVIWITLETLGRVVGLETMAYVSLFALLSQDETDSHTCLQNVWSPHLDDSDDARTRTHHRHGSLGRSTFIPASVAGHRVGSQCALAQVLRQ